MFVHRNAILEDIVTLLCGFLPYGGDLDWFRLHLVVLVYELGMVALVAGNNFEALRGFCPPANVFPCERWKRIILVGETW
uniref:Uncharacterized protein n=1 Tax=Physcomitrium patens TaxID=3218 RepID=A0A2K1J0G5_PHYPA|nr:hypothetical protein PHYPA_022908 [Physcomitrium patens]